MKHFKTTGYISVVLILLLFSSCSNDDISTSGTLQLTFTNFDSDMEVLISPAENTDITLFSFHPSDLRNGSKELNIGNYYIRVSSVAFYGPIGFQISSGGVTSIRWDNQNIPRVE